MTIPSPQTTLKSWLTGMACDDVCLHPESINAEAQENMWAFDRVTGASKTDWEEFVRALTVVRGNQLRARGVPKRSATFYCWHDQQAGQLRVGVVSASHGRLPFGGAIESAHLRDVIDSFLGVVETPMLPVLVWSETLP